MKPTLTRILCALMCTALINGCSDAPVSQTLTMVAEPGHFVFDVPAKGELESAEEISINAPSGNRGTLTLAWLKEENTRVEKGEVIARFDTTDHELEKQRAELELNKNQLTENITERGLEQSEYAIDQQAKVVTEEKAMAEKFTVDNLNVYSKNEIIDRMLSKDYLTAEEAYLMWLQASQQTQGQAQLQLLDLQGKSHRDTIEISREAMKRSEVRAPASGLLIHAENWRGEKVREGQDLWPGSKLASIPSLEKLQARLYVLETEAAGIEMGQPVEIRLDAYPERVIQGEVTMLANIAAPKNRQSPTKYFEVTVTLDESDPDFMRPGQKLRGRILVANKEEVIAIPNQAVFKNDNDTWVYVKKGGDFKKRSVETGLRSLTQTEIVSGIEAGERVALAEPGLEDQ